MNKMRKKIFTFSEEEDLRNQMEKEGIPKKAIFSSIKHEREHFKAAVKLGYNPFYLLEIKKIIPYILKKFSVFIAVPRSIKQKDLEEICRAPSNPSKGDIEMVYRQNKDVFRYE